VKTITDERRPIGHDARGVVRMSRRRRLVGLTIATLVVLAVAIPARSGTSRVLGQRKGVFVQAEVRRGLGGGITLQTRTNRLDGFLLMFGEKIKIQCIQAWRYVDVAYTYSPFCIVCVDYTSAVQIRGTRPNGQLVWIAVVGFGSGQQTVDITTRPSSGPCGAVLQDAIEFPSPWFGYLVVT
jgi:hypothetical protein